MAHDSDDEVERKTNRLKNFRAVATRFDKRAHIFHGTVTVAVIRLWLRPQCDVRSERLGVRVVVAQIPEYAFVGSPDIPRGAVELGQNHNQFVPGEPTCFGVDQL